MSEELKLSFDVLDVNQKRNQINAELLLMNELLKNFESIYNIPSTAKIKNYDQVNDKDLTEGEMLTFLYEDIYNLEQELITALTVFNNNK